MAWRLGVATLCAGWTLTASAADLPSFLQAGDAFCRDESEFDVLATVGRTEPDAALPTCQSIDRPTRVAVLAGQGGVKSMVLLISGPYAYQVGWTNGALPLAK